mgnify:CR=1 FL=1
MSRPDVGRPCALAESGPSSLSCPGAGRTVDPSGDFHTTVPPGTYTGSLRFTLGSVCTGGPITVTTE